MVSEKETKLYYEARNRCLERIVKGGQLLEESVIGFDNGIRLATEGRDLTLGMADKVLSETNFGFALTAGVCAGIEAKKGKGYMASWQKKGMPGALSNMQRKMDRIDAIVSSGNTEGGESLTTNLADLAVYCLKSIALQKELNPIEFAEWIEEARSLK